MFTTIQPHQVSHNQDLLIQSMRLRKRVFADALQWDVPVHGDLECDHYDAMGATYLVWSSADKTKVYGLVRLMTTTGPTLLHDVFYATHGSNPALINPTIWEGTRMCIDEAAIAEDLGIDATRAFNLLFMALAEAANALGIKRLVSNFEACMSRVYRRAGLSYEMHGNADGYGKKPVFCASFAVNEVVIAAMRKKIGIDLPLFKRPDDFCVAVASENPLAA